MPLHLTRQLKRAIQDDPAKCVLFVGAGLSAAGVRSDGKGLPDWDSLMQHMIEDLRDSENCDAATLSTLEEALKEGKHLEIALEFKQRTRPDQFAAFLKAELDPPDLIASRLHEIILNTKFRGIITTNFDVVFESQSDVLEPLVYPQFLEDPSDIQRDKLFVKIHGCIRRTPNLAENLILTQDSYTALRSDRRYRALINVFLLGYRMLTVGFSLRDPDFLGLIDDLREVFGEELPTIYALMLTPDQKARDEWRKRGVQIIPYGSAAGLVDLRFHDTRHTFATRLRANGVHEWDIRDLLGHSSVRMTSVYTHQTPANLCQAVNTLTQTKLSKVVRFPRKKRERSTKQNAPSSRHLAVEQLSAQQQEDVSVRELAS